MQMREKQIINEVVGNIKLITEKQEAELSKEEVLGIVTTMADELAQNLDMEYEELIDEYSISELIQHIKDTGEEEEPYNFTFRNTKMEA